MAAPNIAGLIKSEHLERFKKIYLKEFGDKLSDHDARTNLMAVLCLVWFRNGCRPLPELAEQAHRGFLLFDPPSGNPALDLLKAMRFTVSVEDESYSA